jgi:hypothetical protein
MNFGQAIECLKRGQRVAREGWNGKGMWLVLCDFDEDIIIFKEFNSSTEYKKHSWIGMKTADDMFVPWLASQSDMLSEDWVVVGE